MANNRPVLIHLHTEDVKVPAPELIELGEIAVQHNDSEAALYVKKNGGEISKFIDSNAVDAKVNVEKVRAEGAEKALSDRIDSLTVPSQLIDIVYPVGAIYISTVNTSPKTLFNVGEWQQIKDRFLLAAGDTYAAGSTGGEAKHKLTYAELPSTSGDIVMHGATTGTQVAGVGGCFTPAVKVNNRYLGRQDLTNSGADSIYKIRYSNGGNDEAHNNMPPYLTVYMWKRIS